MEHTERFKFTKHAIAIILAVIVAFAFMPAFGQGVHAAAKKPGTPKITAAQANQNTITLKWSKAKNAKTYQVFRVSGTTWKYWKKVTAKQSKKYINTSKYKLVKSGKKYKVYQKVNKYAKVGTVKTTSFTFKGNYSTSYTFMVRAYNGKKAGKDSAVKTVKTAAKPAPTPTQPATPAAPGQVTGLSVTGSGTSITVSWKAVSGATKYEVYEKAGTGSYASVGTVTGTSLKRDGRSYSTKYTYKVRAINNAGAGAYSSEGSYTVKDAPVTVAAPTVPQNVKTTVSGNTITVTWDAVDGATSYNVSRKKSTEPNIAYTSKSVDKNKYTVTGLNYDTTYNFKVKAVNSAGTSSYSSVATATTGSDPNAGSGNDGGNTGEGGYNPDDLEHLITSNKYPSNQVKAWNKYLEVMLGHYKDELSKRGISINSINKADEFQKLQAIIQVMHDYVGLSGGYMTTDYANYPTGGLNWFYGNNRNQTNGQYYDGKKYCSTIEFYAGCERCAKTEVYLAQQAGLDAGYVIENNSHRYAIVKANDIWYNADSWFYMYPGCNGIDKGGTINPSYFKPYEADLIFTSAGTVNTAKAFNLAQVFSATNATYTNGSLDIYGTRCYISPDKAIYSSDNENVIKFDNQSGTCTVCNSGTAKVTIKYENLDYPDHSSIATFETTILIKVQ